MRLMRWVLANNIFVPNGEFETLLTLIKTKENIIMRKSTPVLYLTYAGVIAALYIVLTWFSALFGLSGMGAIQLRLSEALCVLPYFTAAAVPGVTVGCLLANVFTGAALPDIIFGTLATLLGAIGTRLLRRYRYLAPLPPIMFSTSFKEAIEVSPGVVIASAP